MNDFRLICPKCNCILQQLGEDKFACHNYYSLELINDDELQLTCLDCDYSSLIDEWLEHYIKLTRNPIKFKK